MATAFHEHEGEVACTGLGMRLSEEKLTSGTVLGPLRTALGVAFPGDRLFRVTSRLGLSLEAAGSTLRNTAALKHLGYTAY